MEGSGSKTFTRNELRDPCYFPVRVSRKVSPRKKGSSGAEYTCTHVRGAASPYNRKTYMAARSSVKLQALFYSVLRDAASPWEPNIQPPAGTPCFSQRLSRQVSCPSLRSSEISAYTSRTQRNVKRISRDRIFLGSSGTEPSDPLLFPLVVPP